MDPLDLLYRKWQSVQPLKPEDQRRLDEKFRLEFNYNSNHLEGNTLTYGETKLALLFGEAKGNHEIREYEEMQAHDVALHMIKQEAEDKDRPLTEKFIRQLNEIILVRPFWKEAETPDGQQTRRLISIGEYKKQPNHVRLPNGEVFEYTSPEETPHQMEELVSWYRDEEQKAEFSPIELAALLHYKYIRIHPFDDGNGRIARLLVNYVMYKNGLPAVIIKSEDKKNYLRALHQADAGDLKAFINYIKQQLAWSLETGIKAAKGESIEEPDDLDKKLSLLKRELGESPDETVKIKYDEAAVQKIIQEVLQPLLRAWEEKLKQFDVFFLYRNVTVLFFGGEDDLEEFLEESDFTQLSFENKNLFYCDSISSFINIKGIRQFDPKVEFSQNMKLTFHENAYDITISGLTTHISKLYHQTLSDDEIKSIVLDLGNQLYRWITSNKTKK